MVETRAYLVETMTGSLSRRLDGFDLSWEDTLNDSGGGSLKLMKNDIPDIERRRLRPWWGSILITYVDTSGTEHPKFAGPIVSPVKEDHRTLSLTWAGIRTIFERRYITRDMKFGGLSRGQIAWEILQEAMLRPGGQLPIVHGTPEESGLQPFLIQGWNLANNNVDKLLTQLTEMPSGPDMMFRPRWVEGREGSQIEWVFVHGTRLDPTIPQTWTPDWDTTAERTDVADVEVSSDSSAVTNRVIATGAGQGKDTIRSEPFDNLRRVQQGYPFLETVISVQDEKLPVPLALAAEGHLRSSQSPRDQVTLTIHADAEHNELHQWDVGDAAYVTLDDRWFSIPAGRRLMRIIKAAGKTDGTIKIDMQEDQWGEE